MKRDSQLSESQASEVQIHSVDRARTLEARCLAKLESAEYSYLSGRSNVFDSIQTIFRLGTILDRNGLSQVADEFYSSAKELAEKSYGSESVGDVERLANIALWHGRRLTKLGRFDQAAKAFSRAEESLEKQIEFGANRLIAERIAECTYYHGYCELMLGRYSFSVQSFQRSISSWRNILFFAADEKKTKTFYLSSLKGYSKALKGAGKLELAAYYEKRFKKVALHTAPIAKLPFTS